ncbi:uncharacterized protein LOC126971460 [Leptidea sinapis]|uniref:uncharacterized protein LOC126964569 n=1 Tax=Leptidea sinapis TaxID=189913 RepID=UPI0021C49907|nr:uncharacterized protein LOC126964569 [Leptidea sinapis]XP_050667120.1 uncharacterized protein LOC126966877 [Leptidea sinapis]XP_050673357.1 uncharacterized protein LOC126971219 [Leptidea sinapis]XP_050673742.1 uncharacterized protein LOC126971460 [Leptidea sinapis]
MDALKDSLNAMAEMFEQKMSEFQQGLDNGPITNTSLAAEFNSFRTFVLSAMNTLQRQVEFLGIEVDRLEMRRRRKMLLVHGVSEDKSEDVTSRVCKVVGEHLGVTGFSVASIKSSHRLGRPSEKKPRPIVVKFADVALRDKVWFSKTGFKGSGLTVSEFLTKSRHNLFMEARQRFGINKCWTRDGCIHIIGPDGSHHRAEWKADLHSIPQTSKQTSKPLTQGTASLTSRSKRTVKNK